VSSHGKHTKTKERKKATRRTTNALLRKLLNTFPFLFFNSKLILYDNNCNTKIHTTKKKDTPKPGLLGRMLNFCQVARKSKISDMNQEGSNP